MNTIRKEKSPILPTRESKRVREFREATERIVKRHTKDRETAHRFLVKMKAHDKDGKLLKELKTKRS